MLGQKFDSTHVLPVLLRSKRSASGKLRYRYLPRPLVSVEQAENLVESIGVNLRSLSENIMRDCIAFAA